MNLEELAKPFPADKISWRVGATSKDKTKGIALAYVDARDVMERLDDVCGIGGWQCRYTHAEDKTICEIGVKIDDEWIWKANGAGDTQVEKEKGAISDAFKRAGVMWGVARYLYAMENVWVELKQIGNSYAIAHPADPRLKAALEKASAAAASKPPPKATIEDRVRKAIRAIDSATTIEDCMRAANLCCDLIKVCDSAQAERINQAIEVSKKRLQDKPDF